MTSSAARNLWRHFCDRLRAAGRLKGSGGSDECTACTRLFGRLDELYSAPGRHYHTWEHIGDCLVQFSWCRPCATDPFAVEAAVWFHDAVYDPSGSDNERRSARLAADCLQTAGADPGFSTRTAELIQATDHVRSETGPSADRDRNLLHDIDLSIFAAPRRQFLRYEALIRAEHLNLAIGYYKKRRAELLHRFLSSPRIYKTELYAHRCERTAKENLRYLIELLSG